MLKCTFAKTASGASGTYLQPLFVLEGEEASAINSTVTVFGKLGVRTFACSAECRAQLLSVLAAQLVCQQCGPLGRLPGGAAGSTVAKRQLAPSHAGGQVCQAGRQRPLLSVLLCTAFADHLQIAITIADRHTHDTSSTSCFLVVTMISQGCAGRVRRFNVGAQTAGLSTFTRLPLVLRRLSLRTEFECQWSRRVLIMQVHQHASSPPLSRKPAR